MTRLAGKVAFITGGGGGIGRATAERFAEEGAKVVIAEIDDELGAAAAQSAKAKGAHSDGDALFIHCDVTDRSNVEETVKETVARFGRLDILHNNAGGSTMQDGPVTEAPEEEFWRVIKLDLFRHIPLFEIWHSGADQVRWRFGDQYVFECRLDGIAWA